MMEAIRKYLDHFSKQDDSDWEFFSSKLALKGFSKRSIVLKQGQVEGFIYFVEKGILRFYIPDLLNETTVGFIFEGQFGSAYDSFLTQTPCAYQVETLTPTRIIQISYQDLQEVYEKTSVGNKMGRKISENLFLIKSRREISLLTKTAEERYLDLFSQRPELIKYIPLKYISSYIGITPQALSRIRRRIS